MCYFWHSKFAFSSDCSDSLCIFLFRIPLHPFLLSLELRLLEFISRCRIHPSIPGSWTSHSRGPTYHLTMDSRRCTHILKLQTKDPGPTYSRSWTLYSRPWIMHSGSCVSKKRGGNHPYRAVSYTSHAHSHGRPLMTERDLQTHAST